MSPVLGWLYIVIGVALCVDVYRNSTAGEWTVCDNNKRLRLPWWVPFTGWTWDRNFWGVALVPFWVVLAWPYLLFVRPRLGQARIAIAAHDTADES